jgi:hypothetical protein
MQCRLGSDYSCQPRRGIDRPPVARGGDGRGDGQRAEYVMLNEASFIAEAIVELDDFLLRMARHQRKKSHS